MVVNGWCASGGSRWGFMMSRGWPAYGQLVSRRLHSQKKKHFLGEACARGHKRHGADYRRARLMASSQTRSEVSESAVLRVALQTPTANVNILGFQRLSLNQISTSTS